MIKLQVIGNLGKDAEVREVNGKNVINFSVAHTEKYKDAQGNQQEKTTWVECAHWTDRTGVVPYLTKGTTVYVEGSPTAEAYAGKDGAAKATLRLRVQTVQLLGGKQQAEQSAASGAHPFSNAAPVSAAVGADADDKLPF